MKVSRFEQGSILIETILSMVILSIGLMSVVNALLSSFRALHQSVFYTQALMELDKTLIPMMQQGALTQESLTMESEAFEESRIQVRMETEELDDFDTESSLKILRVEAVMPTARGEKKLGVSTLMLMQQDEES